MKLWCGPLYSYPYTPTPDLSSRCSLVIIFLTGYVVVLSLHLCKSQCAQAKSTFFIISGLALHNTQLLIMTSQCVFVVISKHLLMSIFRRLYFIMWQSVAIDVPTLLLLGETDGWVFFLEKSGNFFRLQSGNWHCFAVVNRQILRFQQVRNEARVIPCRTKWSRFFVGLGWRKATRGRTRHDRSCRKICSLSQRFSLL